MAVEQSGGLDDLLMGNVAEGSEETSEQLAARIAASQARLAAVKKDESIASAYDVHLSKVIRTLPIGLLRFAAWLIDREIPSFTILAILSLSNKKATELLGADLDVAGGMAPDFLSLIHSDKIRKHISLWSQGIILIDRQSTTVRLNSVKKDAANYALLAGGVRSVVENYMLEASTEFDPNALDRIARDIAGWICVK